VARERLLPGAVLTRVAQSHVRVGTFQFFAARGDVEGVRLLADHVIERHYPDAAGADCRYRALLDAVVARQAELIARWQLVGFIHGVMNTDNMSIAGETIDYGPCAFMDVYHPQTVYSSIDQMGRYGFANQPGIAQWNLAVFAQSLLPLLADNEDKSVAEAQESIDVFPALFNDAYLAGMRSKIGLATADPGDEALIQSLLDAMTAGRADFTLTFRRLCEFSFGEAAADSALQELFNQPAAIDAWLERWRVRLQREDGGENARQAAMRSVNPAHIPRNHLVEEVIRAATDEEDFGPFERLIEVLSSPFEAKPENEHYRRPPRPDQVVHQTFCGT
jgi:uncharacterized protein YdiU (UPF0061 family)